MIIQRFFNAIERLKRDRVIRGLQTITRQYNLNRWNILTLRDSPAEHIGMFRACWLTYLCRDYKVSAEWLLTGEGDFYILGWDDYKVCELLGKPKKTQIKRKVGRPRKNPVENQRVT